MGKNNIFVNKKLKDLEIKHIVTKNNASLINKGLNGLLLFILNPIFAHSVLKIIISINRQNLCN